MICLQLTVSRRNPSRLFHPNHSGRKIGFGLRKTILYGSRMGQNWMGGSGSLGFGESTTKVNFSVQQLIFRLISIFFLLFAPINKHIVHWNGTFNVEFLYVDDFFHFVSNYRGCNRSHSAAILKVRKQFINYIYLSNSEFY